MSHAPHPKYRPDIDGLRAVAVLAVVGFHAFPELLPGGFVGVDVFFVISGYLITSIIKGGLDQGSFGFGDFYARRVRRIFPALALVLGACGAAGLATLLPDELGALGRHIAGGAGFVANLLQISETGYFDADSATKPLLHLWSLGVEEQFYLVWPLLLWAVGARRAAPAVLGLGAASFVLAQHEVVAAPVLAFYSPLPRFWEFLVGAGLAVRESRGGSGRLPDLGLAGLGAIAAAVALLGRDSRFPGLWALLPTLGAAALIAAGPGGWVNRRVLALRPLVGLGLISYPLYLWHWPLLVWARLTLGHAPGAGLRAGLVALAVGLAWATWAWLETPLRRLSEVARARLVPTLASAMAVLGVAGLAVAWSPALQARAGRGADAALAASVHRTAPRDACFDVDHADRGGPGWVCALGPGGVPPRVFAYGDSHALSLVPALRRAALDLNRPMLFTGYSGCPPLLGVQPLRGADLERHDCRRLNDRVFATVRARHLDTVILIGRWSYYVGGGGIATLQPLGDDVAATPDLASSRRAFAAGLRRTLQAYREIGVRVILVDDNPQQPLLPLDALRRARLAGAGIDSYAVTAAADAANRAVAEAAIDREAARIGARVDLRAALCDATRCPLTRDGAFLYFDDNHLSDAGAMRAVPALEAALR